MQSEIPSPVCQHTKHTPVRCDSFRLEIPLSCRHWFQDAVRVWWALGVMQLSVGLGRWSTAVPAKLCQGSGSLCDALVQICLYTVLLSCFTHSPLGMEPDSCSFPRKEKPAHGRYRERAGICVSQWPGCIWRALDQVSAHICIHIYTHAQY